LERRLASAEAVEPTAVPDDVVTLNSRVCLRNVETRRRLEVTLADPVNIPLFSDYLSVAGPAGIALLGRRESEIVTWTLGNKRRTYQIERLLYQPEAAGDFHL
jgi:regulator of nucleoside diphosphate kinase